ncbi:hypothetical protein GPALN_001801 [Globodera pallida]|nr:hypothetical protein GPALN_001801 [Globodera pallida]
MIDFQFSVFLSVFQTASSALVGWLFAAVLLGFAIVLQMLLLRPIRLCVGKEWPRFPSSFFLPENAVDRHGQRRAVEMEFVRSEFDGILPAHFAPGATLGESTRHTPTGRMNDANRAEMDRYVPVESCDFLIHLEDGLETELESKYAKTVSDLSCLF